jgi:hypothetical protein
LRLRRAALTVGVAAALSGCGGGSSPAPTPIVARHLPDLPALLKLPVATPSACPSGANGETVGRRSPWVGTVDVSVFLKHATTTHQVLRLGNELRSQPIVAKVYFESPRQAYREFQRLYTCSTSVPRTATPASYRVVLAAETTLAQRDVLVARLVHKPYVDSVSCDPSVPCVDLVASPTPTG